MKVNETVQRSEKLAKAREKFRVKAKHEESDTSWMTGSIVVFLHIASAFAPIYAIYQRFSSKEPAMLYAIVALAAGFWIIVELMKSKYLEKYLVATFASDDETLSEDDILRAMTSQKHNRNWIMGIIVVDIVVCLWAWQGTVKIPDVQPQQVEASVLNAYNLAEQRYADAVKNGNSSRWLTTMKLDRDSTKATYERAKIEVSLTNIGLFRKSDEQRMQMMIAGFLFSCAIGLGLFLVRRKHESNQYERLKSELQAADESAYKPASSTPNTQSKGVMERFAETNAQTQRQMAEMAKEHARQQAETAKEHARQMKEQTEMIKKMQQDMQKKEVENADNANLLQELDKMKKEFEKNGASSNGNGASKNGNGNGVGK